MQSRGDNTRISYKVSCKECYSLVVSRLPVSCLEIFGAIACFAYPDLRQQRTGLRLQSSLSTHSLPQRNSRNRRFARCGGRLRSWTSLRERCHFWAASLQPDAVRSRLAIGKLAGAGLVPSSAVGAEALAVRAAYEAAMRNELPYFAPVTKFPGFARATAATINELRAAGVAAEKLRALEESGPDHAALLGRYEEQMEEISVADRTILLQAALEEVSAGADFAKHPLLLLDVPIHSAIERAFLVALATTAKEVLFTCPAGDLRTLDNLKTIPSVQDKSAPAAGLEIRASHGWAFIFFRRQPRQKESLTMRSSSSLPQVKSESRLKLRVASSPRRRKGFPSTAWLSYCARRRPMQV